MMDYYTNDIETYPNIFTIAIERFSDGAQWLFEMSSRKDDTVEALNFLDMLEKMPDIAMVGFNNVGFDYPIIHQWWASRGAIGYQGAYVICEGIINSQENFHEHMVWESDHRIRQIDLYKIHHFDNQARRTSLKKVEFAMRVPSLMDLPFPPGTELGYREMDELIDYNINGDVVNTREFLKETLEAIEFRQTFGDKYINYNDTKVGKQYFIEELEKAGVTLKDSSNNWIQTRRPQINLDDAVFSYVGFSHPEFQRIHQWFMEQVITETKGVFNDVSCTIDGFKYDFGLGGIHGSVESQTVYADEEYIIEDWDVASYYPNLAIKNNVSPEHLGATFCRIYEDVYNKRKQHAKGTPQNAVMKLALNGVYGDSNSRFSPFYDPLYTMTITINGQLLLCMLADALRNVPDLTMIQINTDGLTIRYPRCHYQTVHDTASRWEAFTLLELEHVEYERMHIRDVNNYIAVGVDGKVKRKGAYEYDRGWHQNHSALVVPKAAERVLLEGISVTQAVLEHSDIYDYCLVAKAPILKLDDMQVQGTTRYYVSTQGGTLRAVKPPPKGMRKGDFKKAQGVSQAMYAQNNTTGAHNPNIHTKNRSKYADVISEVEKSWKTTVCNDMMGCTNPINYEYYFDRVRKLVEPVS
tara:strand:+ start:14308 stop:16221 length:1914 start_codon:yes stop_codon:yes gene_type:complete